ncbi:hypothetical protein QE152_g175 [Popillia japonica]|uniref:Uncharacterized protein n=1 Tax=Popillia japonica TaxID=7064 RepID=A0AAW1NKS3_POPJA
MQFTLALKLAEGNNAAVLVEEMGNYQIIDIVLEQAGNEEDEEEDDEKEEETISHFDIVLEQAGNEEDEEEDDEKEEETISHFAAKDAFETARQRTINRYINGQHQFMGK